MKQHFTSAIGTTLAPLTNLMGLYMEYTDKQIEDFIAEQDAFIQDEWYGTRRELAELIMDHFQGFCNPKKYQMLYKNKASGLYFVSSNKYTTNAEFYADYNDETVLAIRFLND